MVSPLVMVRRPALETPGEETKAARITGTGDVPIYSLFYLDARI